MLGDLQIVLLIADMGARRVTPLFNLPLEIPPISVLRQYIEQQNRP